MKMQVSSDSESWSFTIIRSQGLAPLRPEKGWRPIVTVAFDQQLHEITLGCDGQNPNLKRPFYLQHVDPKSHVCISVWHKSQTKKKARKRNEVATVRITLGDLLKRQSKESKAEIPLTCLSSAHKRGQNGRNKQQHSASLHVKLCPPASYTSLSETSTLLGEDEDILSDMCSSDASSATLSAPPTPTPDCDFDLPHLSDLITQKPKKRRVRGYSMDPANDGELSEVSIDECDLDQDDDYSHIECEDPPPPFNPPPPSMSIGTWLAASLSILPLHAEQDQASVESKMSVAESAVSRFSVLRELRAAQTDEDFAKVLEAVRMEWYQTGACLLGVIAADVTAFSMSSSTPGAFAMTNLMSQIIAASAIFGALGFFADIWFVMRYGTVTPEIFRDMALDINGTYLTFSFTSRLPMLLLFAAASALVAFILFIAGSVWPTAAIVISALAGMSFALGYMIYGFNCAVRAGIRLGRGVKKGVLGIAARLVLRSATKEGEGGETASAATTPMNTPPPAYASVPALSLAPPACTGSRSALPSPLSSLVSLSSSLPPLPAPPSQAPEALPEVPSTPPVRPPRNPARKAVHLSRR